MHILALTGRRGSTVHKQYELLYMNSCYIRCYHRNKRKEILPADKHDNFCMFSYLWLCAVLTYMYMLQLIKVLFFLTKKWNYVVNSINWQRLNWHLSFSPLKGGGTTLAAFTKITLDSSIFFLSHNALFFLSKRKKKLGAFGQLLIQLVITLKGGPGLPNLKVTVLMMGWACHTFCPPIPKTDLYMLKFQCPGRGVYRSQ